MTADASHQADLDADMARAAALLGDAVICAFCGATPATFKDRCVAAMKNCPGFDAFEQALAIFQRERHGARSP